MNKNLKMKKLGEVCDLLNGFAFRSKDYIESSNTMNFRMSQIRPGGEIDLDNNPKYLPDSFREKYKDYLLNDGDIVIAMTDMATETKILGVPTIVKTDTRKLLLNQRVGKLCKIDQTKIFIPFLRYVLTSPQINDYYKNLGRGGLQVNIGKQDILNARIPLPSFTEQKRIVKILDDVFEKTARAKENAEKNLQNARELFESYLQSVFTKPGNCWEAKKLGDVCNFVRGPFGGSLKKSCFKSRGIAVYEQRHAIYNQFEKIRYFIDEMKFNEMQRFEVAPGDLIMSCSGTMGKVAIVPNNAHKGIINQALLKLSTTKKLLARFLKFWMGSPNFQNQLVKHSLGAAIKNVASVKVLKEIHVPLPPLSEQKDIIAKLDALSAEANELEDIYQKKLIDLEELKKSILQKAFKGEFIGV